MHYRSYECCGKVGNVGKNAHTRGFPHRLNGLELLHEI